VITALAVTTGALVVVGMIAARPLATAFAGDYATVPGKLELTIHLTRIMLPFLTLAAIAAAMMGMLNSLHHYFVPALSPATFNVATIAAAMVLPSSMIAVGLPAISAIAIGALAGGVTQILVQWRALHREGFRYRPIVDWGDPALRRILILMGPGTIGLAATQVNVFVNTVLATSEGTGAASWLSYAFRLMYLPIGLFGVSIATVVLPAAARHVTLDDLAAIRRTVARGLGLMLALNVPATIGLIALAVPIVRVLFEHGRFLPSDTDAVAAAVRLYAIGLVGYSAARISSPVFYALGRNRVDPAAEGTGRARGRAARRDAGQERGGLGGDGRRGTRDPCMGDARHSGSEHVHPGGRSGIGHRRRCGRAGDHGQTPEDRGIR
jgi:putative peptidoglycan lipid II flippase